LQHGEGGKLHGPNDTLQIQPLITSTTQKSQTRCMM
jgi:hypothetical protein